jgi:hypothetical protein
MSTAAQLAANQANARLSTGPVSEAGKAISSRNNLRHGFRSKTVLLPGDDPAEYEVLLDELTAQFSPQDLTEIRFVREMADADWRLRRVREHLESALARHMAKLSLAHPGLSAFELQSVAIETLGETGTSYGTWLRYETKFERQYDRAFKDWSRYRELCRKVAIKETDLAIKQELFAPMPGPPPESALNVQNMHSAQNLPQPAAESASNVQIARNAACPCGSRQKYKRCCGRSAPAVFGKAA